MNEWSEVLEEINWENYKLLTIADWLIDIQLQNNWYPYMVIFETIYLIIIEKENVWYFLFSILQNFSLF